MANLFINMFVFFETRTIFSTYRFIYLRVDCIQVEIDLNYPREGGFFFFFAMVKGEDYDLKSSRGFSNSFPSMNRKLMMKYSAAVLKEISFIRRRQSPIFEEFSDDIKWEIAVHYF